MITYIYQKRGAGVRYTSVCRRDSEDSNIIAARPTPHHEDKLIKSIEHLLDAIQLACGPKTIDPIGPKGY